MSLLLVNHTEPHRSPYFGDVEESSLFLPSKKRGQRGVSEKSTNQSVRDRYICPLLLLFLLIFTTHTYACDETIKLGDSTYTIIDEWCGLQIDTTLIPVYDDLGRISYDYTFDSSKIYIRKDARDAYEKMAEAAKKDTIDLIAQSGFRSRGYQARVIKRRMTEGKTFAQIIKFVAPPGYSTHEIGNAVDLKAFTTTFAESKAYAWLKENAHNFGFSETYPKDNNRLAWEPWHWEYQINKE